MVILYSWRTSSDGLQPTFLQPVPESNPLLIRYMPVAEAAAVAHAVDPALAVLDRRGRGVHHHRVGNRRRDLEYGSVLTEIL